MSQIALQVLVGTALISHSFREKLLSEERSIVLESFDLTNEERDFVLSIRADSVKEFAIRLNEWLLAQDNGSGLYHIHDGPDGTGPHAV